MVSKTETSTSKQTVRKKVTSNFKISEAQASANDPKPHPYALWLNVYAMDTPDPK